MVTKKNFITAFPMQGLDYMVPGLNNFGFFNNSKLPSAHVGSFVVKLHGLSFVGAKSAKNSRILDLATTQRTHPLLFCGRH